MPSQDQLGLLSSLLPGIPVDVLGSLSSDHMDALIILAATAYMYSVHLNPRLLEDASHSLWAYDTAKTCAKHPVVLRPVPQFRIDVSPKDVPQAAEDLHLQQEKKSKGKSKSKRSGTADSSARGVICDFAVIFPLFTQSTAVTPKVISELLAGKTWAPHEWSDLLPTIESAHLWALSLTELKRPIIRDPANLRIYVSCIAARIYESKRQLLEQAFCLFSSIRFKHQNKVILKAGAGEWWCFATISRDEMRNHQNILQFSMRNYDAIMGTVIRLVDTNDRKFVEKITTDDGANLAPFNPVESTPQDAEMARIINDRQQATERKARNDERREERRRAREAAKSGGQSAGGDSLKEYQTLKVMEEDYTDADLLRFSELAIEHRDPFTKDKTFKLQFDPSVDANSADLDLATYGNLQWSPVTRMKSPISDAWTAAIHNYLDEAVAHERSKWTRIHEELDRKEEGEVAEALQKLHISGA